MIMLIVGNPLFVSKSVALSGFVCTISQSNSKDVYLRHTDILRTVLGKGQDVDIKRDQSGVALILYPVLEGILTYLLR